MTDDQIEEMTDEKRAEVANKVRVGMEQAAADQRLINRFKSATARLGLSKSRPSEADLRKILKVAGYGAAKDMARMNLDLLVRALELRADVNDRPPATKEQMTMFVKALKGRPTEQKTPIDITSSRKSLARGKRSQPKFAKNVGMSEATVRRIEKSRLATKEQFESIAKYFSEELPGFSVESMQP